MKSFDLFYIFINAIYIGTLYKLLEMFFDKNDYNKKLKGIIYIIYFGTLLGIMFIATLPIIMLLVNLIFISILIIGYIINRYKDVTEKGYNIPKSHYFMYLLVLFGTLYLFILQLHAPIVNINQIVFSGLILILINMTMIVSDKKIYNTIILETENKLLNQQTEALYHEINVINQSTEAVNILKHDFKNHLITLSNLYQNNDSAQFENYIMETLGKLDIEVFSNSQNVAIDSIINFKFQQLKMSNINLTLDIVVPTKLNISAYDLTTIIGNLLDNSIIACENSTEKILDIKIKSKLNNLLIIINNSHNNNLITKNGVFQTTKENKKEHGIGLKSVLNTVKKLDGSIVFDYTETMFCVSVIIPY
ncbi:MAG: hypothetical protein ATN36_06150 [Epulopiscium sp. Nele67-Bin005]|nr:MAG: hypothetical protein ATN36_06150 [Epulopiscium sp. Nele67-Bin005]